MPLKLIDHLDTKERKLSGFSELLKDAFLMLERAQTSHRTFLKFRAKIWEDASKVYEAKGIIAGLQLGQPCIRQHQEITKSAIAEEKLDDEIGKPMIKVLHQAATSVEELRIANYQELQREAGKIDGYYWAANEALEDLAQTINQATHFEDEEDWSGRGTSNGQRPIDGKGNGASVTSISKTKGQNGSRRTKATTKRTTRNPRGKKTREETPQVPEA